VVNLRRAHPGEGAALGSLLHASRVASVPAIPPPVHTEAETREWFAARVLPASEVWVADAAGRAVAVMVLRDDWIDQLYVDAAWTGQGIGSRLLGLAKERRPGGLQLWAFQSNLRARRFYERHGFSAVEETDGSGNEERAPDVRYRW
jgi:GNAT superfamily N-acetyltransferase